MTTITARNMHDLTPQMIEAFKSHGIKQNSRNGGVTCLPGVTSVEITRPMENVCFFSSRDANPFFHLIEAMAMLAPCNSNELLSFFASNMANFSDDGQTYNAFYGTRARETWGDQLSIAVETLRADPGSRRVVVNLWDPRDLCKQTKDMACNLCMIFNILDGRLNMTTFNRSNDAVWGYMTGANMVHFPFFQEYMASALDLEMGSWYHSSANMHVYDWNDKFSLICDEVAAGGFKDPYVDADVLHAPLFPRGERGQKVFDIEIKSLLFQMQLSVDAFLRGGAPASLDGGLRITPFLRWTVVPMFNAFMTYKMSRSANLPEGLIHEAVQKALEDMNPRSDWRTAASIWFRRRIKF